MCGPVVGLKKQREAKTMPSRILLRLGSLTDLNAGTGTTDSAQHMFKLGEVWDFSPYWKKF